ncbi:hypothetical protein PV327_009205 [Microctonus hyperodae]|uniref:G-protein coupled receptors family 3 profile domain-containing protein n=1 Tax=Microctonus hyperodae TaxID=165561 RepID=A0AA39FTA5_MICHY|nr:hypothetical protein PV327_009205 [Microctonus hyperodae]
MSWNKIAIISTSFEHPMLDKEILYGNFHHRDCQIALTMDKFHEFSTRIKIITPWNNKNFDEKNIRYIRDVELNLNINNNNNNDDIEEVILATACSTIACGQMESQGKTENSTLVPTSIKKQTTTTTITTSMIGDIEVPLNKLMVPQKIPDKIVHNPTITSIIQVEKYDRRHFGPQKSDNILGATSNVETFYSHQSKNSPLSPNRDVNHHDKLITSPKNNEKLNETLYNINSTIINYSMINNSISNVAENYFTSSTFDFTTSELDDILEITILGLFEMSQWGEARPEGPSELQAAKLAIERINEMGILSKFRLRLVHNDTRKNIGLCVGGFLAMEMVVVKSCHNQFVWLCDPGVAVDRFFYALYTSRDNTLMPFLLGTACSEATETLAKIVPYWNIVQVSFGSIAPALSDQSEFPLFLRTVAPDSSHNPARIALIKHFGWDTVTALSQNGDMYSLAVNNLVTELEQANITCTATITFGENDYREQLKALKELDTRIIISSFSPKLAPRLFCETSVEFTTELTKRGVTLSRFSAQTYDAVWSMASALSTVEVLLNQRNTTIAEYTHSRRDIADDLLNALKDLNFLGVSGPVSFDGADRVGITAFYQMQGREKLLQDTQLISLICVLLLIDGLVVTLWVTLDPMERYLRNLTLEINPQDRGVVYQPQVEVCRSQHTNGWLASLYAYKGLLLIVGVYMAWETRHVKIPALNDSQYIGMSVYSVVITSGIVVVLANLMSDRATLAFVTITTLILASTTATLALLFLPQLANILGGERADPVVQSLGLKIECNTRRFVTDDRRELQYRVEVQNRVYRREMAQLELELARLEKQLGQEPIDPSHASSSASIPQRNPSIGGGLPLLLLSVLPPVIPRASWPSADSSGMRRGTVAFSSQPDLEPDGGRRSLADIYKLQWRRETEGPNRLGVFQRLFSLFGSRPTSRKTSTASFTGVATALRAHMGYIAGLVPGTKASSTCQMNVPQGMRMPHPRCGSGPIINITSDEDRRLSLGLRRKESSEPRVNFSLPLRTNQNTSRDRIRGSPRFPHRIMPANSLGTISTNVNASKPQRWHSMEDASRTKITTSNSRLIGGINNYANNYDVWATHEVGIPLSELANSIRGRRQADTQNLTIPADSNINVELKIANPTTVSPSSSVNKFKQTSIANSWTDYSGIINDIVAPTVQISRVNSDAEFSIICESNDEIQVCVEEDKPKESSSDCEIKNENSNVDIYDDNDDED